MAIPWMTEYFERQRLNKLGFVTRYDDLDELTVKIFVLISSEMDKEENRKNRADSRKRR